MGKDGVHQTNGHRHSIYVFVLVGGKFGTIGEESLDMERNKEAVCATCLYYAEPIEDFEYGDCNLKPELLMKKSVQWCGQHPDFKRDYYLPLDRIADSLEAGLMVVPTRI